VKPALPGDPPASLLADPRIASLVDELAGWPGPTLASHRSASQFFHKLAFLADIGLGCGDGQVGRVAGRVLECLDGDGVPRIPMAVSPAHGGNGEPVAAWALCDAPVTLRALLQMGCADARLERAVDHLASLATADGFGCATSPELGGWRGPGKASDPCPYATLAMLRLLLLRPGRHAAAIASCASCLLGLWGDSRTRHPYIFYMGNDFRKLKLPFVWYDILHVFEALSQVPAIRPDPRLREMAEIIRAKETGGGWIPESVYQPWKEWDFGQKKVASAWMGHFVRRMLARLDGN
jgi:hypothetical protein